MGFFEKETSSATLDRPKSDATRQETTPGASSLVSHSTPRSSAASEAAPSRSIKSGTSFKVRWTNQDGDVLSEYMQTISHTGKPMGMLNVCRPEGWPAGQYKLEVLLNDTPAATMTLEVK